jgi:hypothetical protein
MRIPAIRSAVARTTLRRSVFFFTGLRLYRALVEPSGRVLQSLDMSKCARCGARKGKRSCPALGASICPVCCAEERLETIPCPRDCPHLASEYYQHRRRRERAFSRGRDFVTWNAKHFPQEIAREFAFKLQADI